MDYILYGNGGSGNHGCEAIIRGTCAVLEGKSTIISISPEEDKRYNVNDVANIVPAITGERNKIDWIKAYIKLKLKKNYTDMDGIAYMPTIRRMSQNVKLALSVGGDNYCYGGTGLYAYLNKAYHANGFKTVLWGCSVEPEVTRQPEVAADLETYDLIIARESISFEALQRVNKSTFLAPDPAFFMEPVKCSVPDLFNKRKVIGINASPMIISNEKNQGITYQNYLNLIRSILETTDYGIALIPHVIWKSNDDRVVLKKLYDEINSKDRVILIEDHSAPELKYIISQCEFFVGARTHATIAAYSTAVPTLVVGYSVKARGIAKDLFGKEEGYVLPVQELSSPLQLLQSFNALFEKRVFIKKYLEEFIPQYKITIEDAKRKVQMIGEKIDYKE